MVEVGWLACEPMRSGEGGRAKSTDGNAGTGLLRFENVWA